MKYLYRCEAEEITVEVEAKAFDPPDIQGCPNCGRPMRRVYSAPNVVYKGDYWTEAGKLANLRKQEIERDRPDLEVTPGA